MEPFVATNVMFHTTAKGVWNYLKETCKVFVAKILSVLDTVLQPVKSQILASEKIPSMMWRFVGFNALSLSVVKSEQSFSSKDNSAFLSNNGVHGRVAGQVQGEVEVVVVVEVEDNNQTKTYISVLDNNSLAVDPWKRKIYKEVVQEFYNGVIFRRLASTFGGSRFVYPLRDELNQLLKRIKQLETFAFTSSATIGHSGSGAFLASSSSIPWVIDSDVTSHMTGKSHDLKIRKTIVGGCEKDSLYYFDGVAPIIASITSSVSSPLQRQFRFLSYCEVPNHLPVTIACHNSERCWDSSPDKRTSIPYSDFPNVMLVYPQFPEVIAFGKQRKKQGVACHHPKLFVLQREDSIRVVVTSANLVFQQWNSVTNTVWRQDFPRQSEPDYSSLFTQLSDGEAVLDSKSDFSSQLAGFMASLVVDFWRSYWTLGCFSPRTAYSKNPIPTRKHALPIYHIQLGFLPRDIAKWVAPLCDIGVFRFSACIFPTEVLAAALEGINSKVRLILYVSQGPKFAEISRILQAEHVPAICSLVASMHRCVGLWRLQEVLGRFKWPESLETDFIYGSSSIGTSVNASFLAAFSAAAGKRFSQFSESEESDPEWGRWNASQELKSPSMKIIFPTIESVKDASSGIWSSRHILCLSEKTWQRLKTVDIFHNAVPHPQDRIGYPMHVKVARRRFLSKTDSSSFGWIYCGSHNFSPAAWGRPLSYSSSPKADGAVGTITSTQHSKIHICNYELGIIFTIPPLDRNMNLDDIVLPFVIPAPKYGPRDRPATAQAMKEALFELAENRKQMEEDTTVEEYPEEEEEEEIMVETKDYVDEEKEEENTFAETLWSQVDSLDNLYNSR
ncbi:uncharacterized protein LOC122671086 [Telopea speciosissima]|uniref:uncharacterized protein LOC122671086 n=1 Tax=Telopea speciosissima TaxID=54955 RepID=UPI001CC4517D|nr:uncharacterized protein LOC122671086 [Telopea speciosissima]